MFWLGREFDKNECKEYKTADGAKKALTKLAQEGNTGLCVWDEDGGIIAGISVDVSEKENQDESRETLLYEENETGTIAGETSRLDEDAEDGDEGGEEKPEEVVSVNMKATVICDGTLNLRRSPEWGNLNICGRASRGQSYYIKEIMMVDGKKMLKTIDGIYISGNSKFVKLETFEVK